MLRIRGTTYHFRRIVPPALRSVLNQREIWVSLRTSYQNEARKRASLLHTRTTELLEETSRAVAEGQERKEPHDAALSFVEPVTATRTGQEKPMDWMEL
ncbi:DUF6538 domain-containing protein [Gluconobacter sphaericus]|uniref:DUF6538 domain-containing protein n=1 Tax=Gluconobacter sphaericus NBRC 12467 TaxID=1307951 RepID=A0AA37W9F8_9PROT|nr:DUF6538 domain-containing protein [Gluconobacter sphaericus]MBF0886813.1 hypothetical protein [Gluconobacter sphaericus]GEB43739.1 hypothetical protein GSP01_25210 [Gluconobacter sphaericus NBRC 12467]GLQ83915.1 hypothetical protein GCM10007872_08230 [Gluconobacter sphaericus NBRC 12467]